MVHPAPTVAVFGLGEAGSHIAADLAAAGACVHGYDPGPVRTPQGVTRHVEPVAAVDGEVDLVLAVTAAADAEKALRQALDQIPEATLYADLSTSSPGKERELAAIAGTRGLQFADVALMSTVPGKGLRTPQLASGPGAGRYAALLGPLGAPVALVGDQAGEAVTRKLLRSILMKGLAALVIEAMRAGEAAGLGEWLWEHLAAEITSADEDVLGRLVQGTGPHALRRRHEMEAVAALLDDLGVDALMARATVEALRRVPDEGLPELPHKGDAATETDASEEAG
jgi:3-hydroxyisobutyrate dehydrogenase-like beta-hydroxyacid dehydrogenase